MMPRIKTLIVLALAATGMAFIVAAGGTTNAGATAISPSDVNNFCKGPFGTDPNGTEYGYYERMYLTNSAGNSRGNNFTINVPKGATKVPVTFKIETWFCKKRPASWYTNVDELEVKAVGAPGGGNRLSNKSQSSMKLWPSGAVKRTYGSGKEMKVPNISAKLNVSGMQDGKKYKLCTHHAVPDSGAPNSYYIGGRKFCFTVTIKFAPDWQLSVSSRNQVDGGGYGTYTATSPRSVGVGDKVQFQHRVKNKGRTKASFKRWRQQTGFDGPGWQQAGGKPPGAINPGKTSNWPVSPDKYTIKSADAGKVLCERYVVKGRSDNNKNALTSTGSCVKVKHLFNLVPSLTGPTGAVAPGGNVADIEPRVTNQSTASPAKTTKTPKSIKWRLGRIDVAPGASIPMGQTQNGSTPQSQYGSKWSQKGDGTRSFPAGATILNLLKNEKVSINTPIGTQICFTLSVQPYSSATSRWRHAVPLCLDVNKRPSVQVWGGDLRATGVINTATTQGKKGGGTATFGSWVEYGAFSSGVNTNFGSGSGLTKGYNGGGSRADWSKLTFANTPNYGSFNFGGATDLATQFTSGSSKPLSTAGVRNVASLTSGTYKPSGDVRITGTVAKGRSIVINAAGHKVTIDGNLNYGGQPYTSRGQIPQLIIIARDIQINKSVTSVNAWLLASATIDTCGDVGAFGSMPAAGKVLKASVCDKRLQVNGPLTASKLILKRTAGGDAKDTGDPAEVFNLRSDAYLWLQGRVADKGQVRTMSTTELPPRF